MSDKDRNTPPPSRFSRFSKTASFWLLIFLIPVLIIQFASPNRKELQELKYSAFDAELQRKNVAEVTVIEGKRLEGKLREAATVENKKVTEFWTLLPTKDSDDLVPTLKANGVAISAAPARQNFWMVLLNMLPWILIIGFWFFMFRQMQAGGSKAFQFGKSKARLLSGDTPKVTFADVAGADEAKYELQEIIEFLKDPQKFSRLGGRLPKGVLLIGPPGTGKTLLARAVAGEAGRPFFSMSGSDFVEMFVGVGASRVRDLFEQGKAHAPCIIFIDEIDAVGRHRGAGLGGGHDEREQTLNQLLVEMDGFESNDGVILIAATNRPDVLDPALLRPGRFDRQIVVDSPDVRGREGILRVHTRKIPLAGDVRLDTIAKGTPGMAGADLANLVNEAAVLAARRNKTLVDMSDFEDAKDKVMLGVERRSLVLTEDERKLTAYHEAGHAVCAMMVKGNDPLHKVTIVPRGRALGVAFTLPEDDRVSVTREQIEARLVMAYGGRVAEELIFGRDRVTTGAASDIQMATQIARKYVTQWGLSDAIGPVLIGDNEQEVFLGNQIMSRREVSEQTHQLVDAEVKRVIDSAYALATRVLSENIELLHIVSAQLLERETLTREDIEVLRRGERLPPRPAPPPISPAPTSVPLPHQPKPTAPPLIGGPEPSPA